jgi:hypothetical protein
VVSPATDEGAAKNSGPAGNQNPHNNTSNSRITYAGIDGIKRRRQHRHDHDHEKQVRDQS